MASTIAVGKPVSGKIKYIDKGGNEAVVDGLVAWTSSDPTRLAITVDPTDSTICTVTCDAGTGNVQITTNGDADLGEGVRPIVTITDVTIVAGEAVAGIVEFTQLP